MASTSSQQLFGEDSSDDEDVGSYFVLDRGDDGPPRFGRAFLAHRARTAGLAPDYEADDPAPARSVAHLGRRILAAETLEEAQVHARAAVAAAAPPRGRRRDAAAPRARPERRERSRSPAKLPRDPAAPGGRRPGAFERRESPTLPPPRDPPRWRAAVTAPAPAPARVATIQARPVVAKVKRRTKGFDLEGVAGAKKPRAVPPPYSAVVPRPRSPTPEPESPPTPPLPKPHKGATAAAVGRARKQREELDEGSPRLAAPTYAPGNGTPFRAPGANGHANGANGFSESDLALL